MGKAQKKTTNWAEYNKALCKRGRGFQYSDTAIETAFMIKGMFSLLLCVQQGFIDSIFKLLDVPLTSPDYTCISKRSKTVQVRVI
ncbi:transposase [Vibrio cholerae]|nr:transposase [Vibrio cholerae]